MNPYETLGVAQDATSEQVRAAFKKLAKRHHPDVAGGENEAFDAIRLACDVLCDPAARKLYDEWGVIPGDPASALVLRARQEIAGMFASLLAQATPSQLERTDVIGTLRRATEKAIADADSTLRQLDERERQAEEYQAILTRRLRRGEKPDGLFAEVVATLTGQVAAQRASLAGEQAVKHAVLVLLDGYSFDFQSETQRTISASGTGWPNCTTWRPDQIQF